MMKKKFRIGIFASSASLIERIQNIADRQNDYFQIAYEGLENALPIGKKMEQEGVEVIVSRRGTAHLLRESLHIPVLAFPMSSLDILFTLKEASVKGDKILLPVFRNRIRELEMVKELLDIEFLQGTYNDSESLRQLILMEQLNGADIVIGGSVTMRIAREFGIKFVEIVTSDEDIAATLENAKSVAQSNREEKAATQRYRSIIDATSDGIVAVNEAGRITTINLIARKLLKINDNEVLGKPVGTCFPSRDIESVLKNKAPIQDRIEKVGGEPFVCDHLPVMLEGDIIGGITTFKEISNVMRAENKVRRSLARGLVARYTIEDLIHESASIRDIVNMAKLFAGTDSTILIMGETGTGKEILAQSIHNLSHRKKQPFVSINCAALPDQLLESELFGYEEGAFTGSKKGGKPGRFEISHKGTIFLDEIDATPENVQIRLLRVLQEREVMRLGGNRKIPVDVRVIAAAGKDLGKAVQEKHFREDLFFRLNVLRIQLPPLRERTEDIPVLLSYFIRQISEKDQLQPVSLPNTYLDKLTGYSWPGNVRQLRNFAERVVLNCNLRCSTDMLEDLYKELKQYPLPSQSPAPPKKTTSLKAQIKARQLEREGQIILGALKSARFSKTKAAKSLGISRTTLWRKIKETGIE